MSLKLSELIKQYSGEDDVMEWINKLELVARLQNIENLCTFLPLFLTGGAFNVYQSLSEEDKQDYGRLKKVFVNAFSVDQYTAYEKLKNRKLRMNESVDVYLAELRYLTSLVCRKTPLSDCEELIKVAFVSGLPDATKNQLKAICAIGSLSLQAVVERARNLKRHEDSISFAIRDQEAIVAVNPSKVEK